MGTGLFIKGTVTGNCYKPPTHQMINIYYCNCYMKREVIFQLSFNRKCLVSVRNTLLKRLRTHKVFTKDQCFYLNYHKISIKSYVVDVY